MLLKDFYEKVGKNEITALTFLREQNLLGASPLTEPCHRCGSKMKESRRRERGGDFRPVLRCLKKGCQTSRSVRKGNEFFHYMDMNQRVNSRLKLCDILEIVWFFVMDIPQTVTATLTGRAAQTVNEWYFRCREVCSGILQSRNKMSGTEDNPVRIHEARFGRRRKSGSQKIPKSDPSLAGEDEDEKVDDSQNGSWVFELKHGKDLRYFYVERRDRKSLVPIIKRECAEGSFVLSQKKLSIPGYHIVTSIRGEDFKDIPSDMNAQYIECSLLEKIRSFKKSKGLSSETFQSHLDAYCWRELRKNEPDLYLAFLKDVKTVYRR